MLQTDTHIYFYGRCSFSNWHPVSFRDPYLDIEFNNSEQAFMYFKALCFNDIEIASEILFTNEPKEAKELGRKVRDYDNKIWDCLKEGIMNYVVYLKFSQNEDLKNELLSTGNKVLVEASPVDKIWGVGLAENDPLILDEKNWLGQNLLGKSLIKVRELLK